MASADPEVASAAARVAGLANVAQTPPHIIAERMAHARAAQHQLDLDAADAAAAERGEVLDDEERERRAALHRRERLARASLASVKARKAKAADRAAEQLAAELDQLAALEAGVA